LCTGSTYVVERRDARERPCRDQKPKRAINISFLCPISVDDTATGNKYDAEMALSRPHAKNLRRGRYSRPGHYYFLTASAAGRRTIFAKRKHALLMLETIRWLHTANRFSVDAAVVMPDHLHIVGQLGECTLDKVMHSLKSYSARGLAVAGVATPVWQKGYYDHGLRDDEDYRSRVEYVLQNPLRAGLVRRVEDYPYIMYPEWWG